MGLVPIEVLAAHGRERASCRVGTTVPSWETGFGSMGGIGKVRYKYLVRALMAESASYLGESDVECVAALLTYQVAFRDCPFPNLN